MNQNFLNYQAISLRRKLPLAGSKKLVPKRLIKTMFARGKRKSKQIAIPLVLMVISVYS